MFSANASQAASGAGAANYIEDVFSTYLYDGGTAQSINNGIDLSTKGGLVWFKFRSGSATETNNELYDTARGTNNFLVTNTTAAQVNDPSSLNSFNTNGFSIVVDPGMNASGSIYASWTFRKQPKFFDVVTWTGDGASSRAISHNLGSTPGCVIVKRTNNIADWVVYHRSVTGTTFLNLTDAVTTANNLGTVTAVDSTTFTVTAGTTDGRRVNSSANTYVAYLFAHNAGGFGLTGTDNVISCGSFTTDGSGNATVDLGYEPQWLLIKSSSSVNDWTVVDNMRGWVANGGYADLNPNLSAAEDNYLVETFLPLTATGFKAQLTSGNASKTYIYIAIRRGPMKTPTSGTSVFSPEAFTGDATSRTIGSITTDLLILRERASDSWDVTDRLRGTGYSLVFNSTAAEANNSASNWPSFNKTQLGVSYTGAQKNQSGTNYIDYLLRRAPGFFDEVCYTGTGGTGSRNIEHNLTAAPQLLIIKQRSTTGNWIVYNETIGAGNRVLLNTTAASGSTTSFASTAPTASVFTVDAGGTYNTSGTTYVAYLFASCPGVSKVGSYTGTGATQTVSCGFAARFVLIKRTDSTGDWFVWDTARGMVAGTDPRLALNSTAAETNANWVYTDAAGFQIVTTDAAVNASGGSYIFLAIA